MLSTTDRYYTLTEKIKESTGIANPVPGTVAGGLAQSVAYTQDLLERDILNFLKKDSVSGASGYEMDLLYENLYGIKRRDSIAKTSSKFSSNVIFYVEAGTFGEINSGNSIQIPQGTRIEGVSPTGYVSFRVEEPVVLLSTESNKPVTVSMSEGFGETIPANTLVTHTYTGYTFYSEGLLKVTNQAPIAAGRAKETDDNFRFRAINAIRSFAYNTKQSIHSALTNIPGISDVITKESPLGGGVTNVYIKSVTPIPAQELIDQCKSTLYQVLESNFNVLPFNTIGLSFNITIQTLNQNIYTNNQSFKNLISNSIISYINNYSSLTLDIYSILDSVYAVNSDIISVQITSSNFYNGDQDFRTENAIDLTDTLQTTISINDNEKFIVEIIPNAINLSINP